MEAEERIVYRLGSEFEKSNLTLNSDPRCRVLNLLDAQTRSRQERFKIADLLHVHCRKARYSSLGGSGNVRTVCGCITNAPKSRTGERSLHCKWEFVTEKPRLSARAAEGGGQLQLTFHPSQQSRLGPAAWDPPRSSRYVAAATKKRTIPSAKSASPGQLAFSPRPRPGLRGSRVSSRSSEADGILLSRPRQIGGPAVNKIPLRTHVAAIQMSSTRFSSPARLT
jgi:hypothetical protein